MKSNIAGCAGANSRFQDLRAGLQNLADPAHAEFHRAYHKSSLNFYGLRTPAFDQLMREQFPARQPLEREETLKLVALLQSSAWAEERWASVALLDRIKAQLGPGDLPMLKAMAGSFEGWGLTDMFSLRVLGPLALRLGEDVYEPVQSWLSDPHMWTRRAAILVHIIPGRKSGLNHAYAWSGLEARLAEKEFFIRKAIGWTLREIGKHYPEEVCEFLLRVGERASGLTRREGARNLPEQLRIQVLGR
jgi:3-methyladenine DNA glycosylase AlkD